MSKFSIKDTGRKRANRWADKNNNVRIAHRDSVDEKISQMVVLDMEDGTGRVAGYVVGGEEVTFDKTPVTVEEAIQAVKDAYGNETVYPIVKSQQLENDVVIFLIGEVAIEKFYDAEGAAIAIAKTTEGLTELESEVFELSHGETYNVDAGGTPQAVTEITVALVDDKPTAASEASWFAFLDSLKGKTAWADAKIAWVEFNWKSGTDVDMKIVYGDTTKTITVAAV